MDNLMALLVAVLSSATVSGVVASVMDRRTKRQLQLAESHSSRELVELESKLRAEQDQALAVFSKEIELVAADTLAVGVPPALRCSASALHWR